MSFTLTDGAGRSINVNAWNWGVLHYAVACAKPPLFEDEEELDLLRFGGIELTRAQVDDLALYLSKVILPMLKPGQRMLADFSVTDEPDDGTLYRDDLSKNYSLHYEVLASVVDFLRAAQAPVTVS